MTKKSRVTRITIGRLWNLGNYEHIRYEITAEVPRGGSPKRTFQDVSSILRGLKPVRAHPHLDEARKVVATQPEERSEFEKDHLEEYCRLIEEHNAKEGFRKSAIERLDNVGGISERKDAKKDWQDEDDMF